MNILKFRGQDKILGMICGPILQINHHAHDILHKVSENNDHNGLNESMRERIRRNKHVKK